MFRLWSNRAQLQICFSTSWSRKWIRVLWPIFFILFPCPLKFMQESKSCPVGACMWWIEWQLVLGQFHLKRRENGLKGRVYNMEIGRSIQHVQWYAIHWTWDLSAWHWTWDLSAWEVDSEKRQFHKDQRSLIINFLHYTPTPVGEHICTESQTLSL